MDFCQYILMVHWVFLAFQLFSNWSFKGETPKTKIEHDFVRHLKIFNSFSTIGTNVIIMKQTAWVTQKLHWDFYLI